MRKGTASQAQSEVLHHDGILELGRTPNTFGNSSCGDTDSRAALHVMYGGEGYVRKLGEFHPIKECRRWKLTILGMSSMSCGIGYVICDVGARQRR